MGQAGYEKQSSNLNRRIKDARISMEGAWRAAFMDTYERLLPKSKNFFKAATRRAIENTQEFDDELFLIPIMRILDEDDLYIVVPSERTKTVSVFLAMEEFAGTIDEYFEAVDLAREIGGFGQGGDPDVASIYWRDYLYRPAREASAGRPTDQQRKLTQKYWMTLELRVASMAGKAPWWYILEHGNNFQGRGEGQPYPSHGAQRFVDTSERVIQALFDEEIDFVYEDYLERISVEGIGSEEVAERIEAVVTEVTDNPGEYHAGDIIAHIMDRGRRYTLYISRTGQLGYSLRPRF